MAGYTVVPAIIRSVSDVESLELSLIENVVRQELNAVDEAFALHVLLDDLGVTQEALAERIGKSRAAVANKIRLLELPAEVQELIVQGTLTEGHGRALLGAKKRGYILRLARRAANLGLSVRAVEAEVQKLSGPSRSPRPSLGLPVPLLDEARDRFWEVLEVVPRVRVKPGEESGRIELPFKDGADLQRILGRLGEV
jgi:ParB family chromosome partitioning protein